MFVSNIRTWLLVFFYAEEAKHSAEEAKLILLKTKKDSDEAIAKFKLEPEQDMATLKKHKEAD